MNINEILPYYLGQQHRQKQVKYSGLKWGDWQELRPLHLTTISTEVQLALRPLSSMTEEEMKELFQEVSLISLDDYDFEFIDDDREDGTWGVNALGAWGAVQDTIKWENGVLWVMNNDHSFSPVNPQSDVFHWMVKKGFDLWNLIPQQIAIDSTTLTP